MFELQDVTKRFDSTAALTGLSLTIEPGRTTVLIGPSGCGKSTLLRLMIGLIVPDAGRIRFGDAEFSRRNVLELRRKLGYVIQDGGLFPHLSARDNISLAARPLRLGRDRIERRIRELIELTRFPEDALDRFPGQLSGGQCQRVSLMRALMLDPEVLLLDEPLGSLDPMIRSQLQEELRAIFRALEKTVVLVTHDLSEAGYLGDTLVLLRDGRIVQTGTYQDLLHAPKDPFTSAFVRAQRRDLDPEGEAPC